MKLLLFVFAVAFGGAATDDAPVTTAQTFPDLETVLTNRGNFSIFLDLLKVSGVLGGDLSGLDAVSVFAPLDSAFDGVDLQALKDDAAGLQKLIRYHISAEKHRIKHNSNDHVLHSLDDGKPIRINYYSFVHTYSAEGVPILEVDIRVNKGYMHVISSALTPPSGNIVDILAGREDMTKISALIKEYELDTKIREDENMTMFAPTDSAFSKLHPDVLDHLLKPFKKNKKPFIIETVMYHVVNRRTLYSVGMQHSMTLSTADGHNDRVMLLEDDQDRIFVNHALIIKRDISATNGVIHVINEVLIPVRAMTSLEDANIPVVG